SYRNARHTDLLASSPALPWPQLAEIQSAIARTSHPLERDELAREFARRVRALADDEDEQEERELEEAELETLLGQVEEVDFEREWANVERAERTQLAHDYRTGGITGQACTF